MLAPGSIRTWDEMADKFCRKYFQHEERVTIAQLNNTRQQAGENLVEFLRQFRDLALDCYDEKDEESLMEICIGNILPEYRVYLENIGITQFYRLIEAVRRTSMSVKTTTSQGSWRSDKKDTSQRETRHALMADERHLKRKERSGTVPAIPCSDEELHAILDTMFADGVIKPVKRENPLSREDKKNPRYCRYHQIVGHPTPACQTLRKILHAKIDEGTLELPSKKQAIDDDPLPKRLGKGVCSVITGVDKTGQGEENMYGALALSVYQSPIDQAAWYEYCRGQGYADPFFTQYDWNNNSAMEGQTRARFNNDDHCYQAYQVTEVDDNVVETNFMRNNLPSVMEVLQQNPIFKSLFDQLEYRPEARYATAKGLMDITEKFGPQCFASGTETQRGRSLLEGDNAIVFTDKDIEVDYPNHRRPL
ncbi:hypothetical protein ACLB2K_060059 [Fragaria x ananassa]